MFGRYCPNVVFHLATETGFEFPKQCIQTNIYGTVCLLEAAKTYIEIHKPNKFLFVNVSTDEVFGFITKPYECFTEQCAYRPSDPYAASKAASNLIVGAWLQTYGVPSIIVHCPNNYGHYQQADKMIPTIIDKALGSELIHLSATKNDLRDWIHVNDQVAGLYAATVLGHVGETYNLSSNESWTDEQIVNMICKNLDELCPRRQGHQVLIKSLAEPLKPQRRCISSLNKSYADLLWLPKIQFAQGLKNTVKYYLVKKLETAGIKLAG